MRRFEYDIVVYSAGTFKEIVSLCTSDGHCWDEELDGEVSQKLLEKFNERGGRGWELIHLSFSARGAVSFWKREVE